MGWQVVDEYDNYDAHDIIYYDAPQKVNTTKKKVGSTVAYTSGKVATGAASVFEGIADTGAWLLKQASKTYDVALQTKPLLRKVVEIWDPTALDYKNTPFYQIGEDMIENEIVKTIDTSLDKSKIAQESYIEPGSLGANIASGVGQVGGMILTGKMFPAGKVGTISADATRAQRIFSTIKNAATSPTIKSMFLSTFGNSYSQAYNEGADDTQASIYGLLNAIKESGTEMMYGGLGAAFGKGALDEVATEWIKDTIKNKLLSKITQLGIGMFAEGVEELTAGILDPFVESVYKGKLDFTSYNNLANDFIAGALISGILQAPGTLIDLKNKSPEEVIQQIEQTNEIDKRNEKTKAVENIIQNENIDNETKLTTIDNQINSLITQLTQDTAIGNVDIEGIYKQISDLRQKKVDLSVKMTDAEKIAEVNRLTDNVLEDMSIPQEQISEPIIENIIDKATQAEKLTKELEKDKKVKVLTNKQKIKVNGQQYINEAAAIIEQMNVNIPEGKERVTIVTELNPEQRQIMDLASVFGKQVIFTENMPQSGAVLNKNPNILFIDKNINSKLIKNENGAMLYTMGHELFHSLRMTDIKTYGEFIEYTKETITLEQLMNFVQNYDEKNANQMLNDLKIDGKFDLEELIKNPSKYPAQSKLLTDIVEEMVANEFGGMISDKTYMNKLYNDNPSLFKKVIDAIKELFKSLTGSVYDSSLTQLQVEKIRNDFETIVSEIQQKAAKKPATALAQENAIKESVVEVEQPVIEKKKTETKKSSEYQIPEIIYRGERTTQIKGQGLPIYGEGLYFTPSEKRAANFGTVKEYDSKTLKFEKPYVQGTQYNDKMLSILNEYVEKHPEKQSELKLILNNGKPLTKSFMSPSEIKQAYLDAGYDSFIRDSKGQEEYVMFAQRDLGMKTTQMSLEDRYTSITKNFDRYNNEKISENKKIILNSLLKSYQNYKKDGGTETNTELDTLLENQGKSDFKDKLKQQGLNIKELPKAMPLSMRRQLFNREITIPEGMSLGEAINIYRKNPNNKRLLTRTIEPVEYAKDVTPSDIGKVLELNRVEVLNPEKIEWDRATGMFGKGMYFSLTKGTTRYYQNEYKDAKYLVDKYDVDTKDMFILQQEQIYDDNRRYLPGRYDVYARDELSNAMIKQGILTEQERNEIKNKNNHFVQTYNEMLKEKGYKGIAVFVHPTDSKNGEVTYFGGNQLVLFDTSKAIRKQSEGFVGKEYYPGYERDKIKYLPKIDTAGQQKESQFYTNTVTNSPIFKSIFDEISKNKDFRYYTTVSHKSDFDKAIKRIQENGDAAINEFLSKDSGFDTVDSAMAKILIEYYQRTGDVQSEVVIATKIRKAITQGAQLTESAKIFKDLSPASVVVQIQNDITTALEELQRSTDPTVRAWLNDNLHGANLSEAEREWVFQMAEKARKMKYDSPEYRRTYALIQSFVASKIPKSIATKVKAFRRISMLFNPKTMVRNFAGNAMMQPVNRFADVFGSVYDSYLSKKSGVRTQGMVDNRAFKEGKRQGLAEAKQDFKLGINTSRTNPYEIQQGKTYVDKGVGKTLNWIEKWMNYGLNAGDRGFEEAYYQNSLANQMRLNNVTEATETMKQIAQQEAEKKTWKNDGKMMRMATSARNLLNSAFRFTPNGVVVGKQVTESQYFGLGDLVLPFIMTPANLAVAIYDYSPAAALSVANNARKYNNALKSGENVEFAQKALVDSFGKASVGVLLYAIAYALANAGLISGGEDEDKDIRATMKAQGYQPYSIKIGDLTFSYDWAQPLANPFATMAELHRQTEMNKNNPNKSNEANNAFKAISEAFTIGGDRLYEQSFLQSLKNLLSAESPKDGIIQFSTDLPQSFVPTLFKQVADMIDGTAKSTYDGNNLLTTMFAKAMVKIPFVKSLLPTKKDILGNDVQMYGGENNIFNVMFNPANVSKDVMGDIGTEIMDVYNHTGENGVMPQVAIKYIDYDTNADGVKERITFDNAQQATLQEYMGTTMANAMNEMLNNDVYQNASYEDKATALISLMQYSKAIALRDTGLVANYEIKSGNAAQINSYVNKGLSIPNAVMYDSLINQIQGYKDSNGNSVKGSENGQKAHAIMNMQIDDNSKDIMLKLISPTANTPETTASLSNLGTVQQFVDYYSLPRRDTFLMDKFSRDDYDISTVYFNIAGNMYMEFAGTVSQITADYDSKGNVIANSRKNKVFQYINSLPLNQYQKIYLFSVSGYSVKQWKNQMYNYINSMNVSADEKRNIWSSLGLE